MAQLLPPAVLAHLAPRDRAILLGKEFFPHLISGPFMAALHTVFIFSACLCLIAAIVSYLRGRQQRSDRATGGGDAQSDNGERTPVEDNALHTIAD